MNESVEEYTPKQQRISNYTTSTANKNPKPQPNLLDFDNSLGILSLNSVDISKIDDSKQSISNIDLEKQRSLANESIQRANSSNIGLLPSRYFKPDLSLTSSSVVNRTSDSTISESDLLKSFKNTSTPRNSSVDVGVKGSEWDTRERMSVSAKMVGNPNISIDSLIEEFKKNRSAPSEKHTEPDSEMFLPAEEAEERLRADEQSWRQRNEVPLVSETSFGSQRPNEVPAAVSLGAYFGQKSDDISSIGLNISPPERARHPVALVDTSASSTFLEKQCDAISNPPQNSTAPVHHSSSKKESFLPLTAPSAVLNNSEDSLEMKSLSTSAIGRIISQFDADSPDRVIQYLCQQAQTAKNKASSTVTRNKSSLVRNSLAQISNAEELPQIHSQTTTRDNTENASTPINSVPVSANTSYTSNYSENEALANIAENKENINSLNVPLPSTGSKESSTSDSKDGASSRTSSSLTSLPDGKLPIESTKSELIWGCVKINKTSNQEFLIRNRTAKTLRLQCHVSGRDFKIRKEVRNDAEYLSACKLVLYAHESRAISVCFAPTKIGSAIDELVFAPLDASLAQTKKQCIRLFGYGGHTNIGYVGPMKDNTGKFWLSLGKLDCDRPVIEHSFSVNNSGTLPAFVYIMFTPRRAPFFENLNVSPNFFVLLPNDQKFVSVKYTLDGKDCKWLQQTLTKSVAAGIGTLDVISDAEATRGRLKRLCRKCEEKRLSVPPSAVALIEKIRGEAIPLDTHLIKESPGALKELLDMVTHDEIALTIEQDPDQTLVPQIADETVLFQTICAENSMTSNDTVVPVKTETCKLEPLTIVLNPPAKVEDYLFLTSNVAEVQHFECAVLPVGLDVAPSSGTLNPGETVVFKVRYPKHMIHKTFKIMIYVENDCFEANVKIVLLNGGRCYQVSRGNANFL